MLEFMFIGKLGSMVATKQESTRFRLDLSLLLCSLARPRDLPPSVKY